MAEILSYNHYRDMHNDVQFSAMFFGKNIQNIPFFSSTQTSVKEFDSYGLKVFTFTGKERDSETGFSYFGARYYDSDLMTGWLSVDPMADKYPSLSPYAYCAWNPILFRDPDGKEKVISFSSTDEDKRIACAAENYQDNSPVIHLWAHGSPNTVTTYDQNDNSNTISSWKDMHEFLNKESHLYSKESRDPILILVMHCCETGQGDDNIAKKISSGLDLLVVAPTETIITQSGGTAPNYVECDDLGTMVVNKETKRREKLGVWNVYYKGVLVETLNSSQSPFFADPQTTIEHYEKIYQQKIQEE